MNKFSQLPLSAPLVQGLEALAYAEMTPIQAASLPLILDGKDVIAQAKTGSGKTAAFGLGLLSRLDPGLSRVQALVLCPTRELADQVSKELRRLARFIANVKVLTLCGGISLRPQIASLVHEPHIVVGTPGRIQELLDKEHLSLDAVKVLVLDEADRMLDMGFAEAIADVIAQTPADRQTLLFSATYANEIRSISKKVQRDPVEVTVESLLGSEEIEQMFYEVETPRKVDALAYLLSQHRPESALVFCNTKRDTTDVAEQLAQRGILGIGAQWRPRATRSRRSAGPLRQQELLGAGRHRRGGAGPGHQGTAGGGQFRIAFRPGDPRAPHRAHGAGRAQGTGPESVLVAGDRPGAGDRGGPGRCGAMGQG